MTDFEMRDAAYASNLAGWGGAVAGYLGGPNAYHKWSLADWAPFVKSRQPKLPIWVGGLDGTSDGTAAVALLRQLGVPLGCVVVLDMETRRDITYVESFGHAVQWGGYYASGPQYDSSLVKEWELANLWK